MYNYGQKVKDKVFDKLDELHRKKIEKHIDQNRPNQIYKTFPDDKILSEDSAITYLTKSTGLDEDTVIKSINTLIKDRKLITAHDHHKKLHLRKNHIS
jgi:hypothetical protein